MGFFDDVDDFVSHKIGDNFDDVSNDVSNFFEEGGLGREVLTMDIARRAGIDPLSVIDPLGLHRDPTRGGTVDLEEEEELPTDLGYQGTVPEGDPNDRNWRAEQPKTTSQDIGFIGPEQPTLNKDNELDNILSSMTDKEEPGPTSVIISRNAAGGFEYRVKGNTIGQSIIDKKPSSVDNFGESNAFG